jgi:hypothetical protein
MTRKRVRLGIDQSVACAVERMPSTIAFDISYFSKSVDRLAPMKYETSLTTLPEAVENPI